MGMNQPKIWLGEYMDGQQAAVQPVAIVVANQGLQLWDVDGSVLQQQWHYATLAINAGAQGQIQISPQSGVAPLLIVRDLAIQDELYRRGLVTKRRTPRQKLQLLAL